MYKYHSEHTWLKMDGEQGLVGLSFYAQAHLGEIVYVDIPEPGSRIQAGQVLGGIESTKTTSEIIAPVTGTVVESNQELVGQPELINESPLELGWITRVSLDGQEQIESLMDLKAYEAYLASLPQDE
jgi:glycine cleavage system H protein